MENYRRNLVEHIKKNLSKGYDEESLKYALIKQGYSRIEVNYVIRIAKKEIEERKKPEKKEKPIIKYEIYGANNKPIREPFWRRIYKKWFH